MIVKRQSLTRQVLIIAFDRPNQFRIISSKRSEHIVSNIGKPSGLCDCECGELSHRRSVLWGQDNCESFHRFVKVCSKLSLAQVLYVSVNGCRCIECFSVPNEDLLEGFDVFKLRQLCIHVNFVASSYQCPGATSELVVRCSSCVRRQGCIYPVSVNNSFWRSEGYRERVSVSISTEFHKL